MKAAECVSHVVRISANSGSSGCTSRCALPGASNYTGARRRADGSPLAANSATAGATRYTWPKAKEAEAEGKGAAKIRKPLAEVPRAAKRAARAAEKSQLARREGRSDGKIRSEECLPLKMTLIRRAGCWESSSRKF
ncbi:uncharacterized protein LOC124556433 [Schistocerca americana]|uniref:uncharacterized protein LOC124556433 n=1 Tax=Schistocerca americana TaxID=7009 RepID=UPI001F500067|nr:uncharacterized protein LOC124556433 [Schistocerca americana]